MFRIHSNPKVAQYMGDGKPLTYERCVKWIEISIQNYKTKGFGVSAVIEKSTHELIGCCGLNLRSRAERTRHSRSDLQL
ncbi:GNAT family N-acetyltransferase [Calothrix sp. 336/3]|uniref:GNAT family N-acetyltransferase n=1 Tax=Calothrix sp. 336/3 TaxID=1337936 RepID=UPI003529ACDF